MLMENMSPEVTASNKMAPLSKQMFVVNRKGESEQVEFDKILRRIQRLSYGLHPLVDAAVITQTVINGMFSGIKTSELDELTAQTCAYMAGTHPDFSKLAARVSTSNLHKNTDNRFDEVIRKLHQYNDKMGQPAALISDDVYEFVMANKESLNGAIKYERDFEYDYFGFKTLERLDGEIVERPQHLIMRVSCGIHTGDVEKAIETYELMSQKFFTHATPTLFNAGTPRPQMSSCFLMTMKDDSIDGIYDTLKQCAQISKTAGGIGVAVHNIRATGSYIRGTNGRSNGIVPMLRVFNMTARYVDQGGGKRKGSIAIYLEPWHPDIFEYLDLRKNHGPDDMRTRDLFFALWIPDLFMQRVEANQDWTFFCPNEAPGLADVWGEEFKALYEKYEKEGRGRRSVKAQTLWFAILQSQIETGTPFMVYKDACNRKSNQKHLGTIKSSNLCTEIIEYTTPDEVAVCNLASVALPKFVNSDGTFDYNELHRITKVVTANLNRVIDRNYYPVPEARRSNMRHRPIGIGVQGLADTFMLMRLPYDSEGASKVNATIFETLYHAAVEASIELAEKDGAYETFPNSPASQGLFQFDMWNQERAEKGREPIQLCGLWDWETLRKRMIRHGMRNSLLLAPMPTASTSQILGNNESFEPYTSNIYYRRVLSGEFFVLNPHLLRDLLARDLWCENIKQRLMAANGSILGIPEIPDDLKSLYKTVWEIKQKVILDMAADRSPFIDQSQSLNVHLSGPTFAKLSSMHFYGWKLGLKTGQYYLRTQAAVDAIKFTVDKKLVSQGLTESRQKNTGNTNGVWKDKGENNNSCNKETSDQKDDKNEKDGVAAIMPITACPRRSGIPVIGYDDVCESCSG